MAEESATARALRLLSLLQGRRSWTSEQLADRLHVTTRTLRRDVERLRALGYRVDARPGAGGGYRLVSGTELPPLVFTDEEAVAMAVGLAAAASTTAISGLDDIAVSALAKIEHVLPKRLRGRVSAIRAATASSALSSDTVDPETLAQLASACRDGERVRLQYGAAWGPAMERLVEPAKLVPRARRWYLLCWDHDRQDWRTLRVDRVSTVRATGVRAAPRALPAADAAEFVEQRFTTSQPVHEARILLHAPVGVARAYLGVYASGLQAASDQTSLWVLQDSRLESLAARLVWIPWDFEVLEPADLRDLIRDVGRRFQNSFDR